MRAFPQAKMMPPTPPGISSLCCVKYLSKIAAPDTGVQSATDLGVVVRGEDLSVTGLAVVGPAVGLGGTDAVKTGEGGDLAKPAADEDVLEVVSIAGSKDLAVRARVELVDHLAVGGDNGIHGVGLELGVVGKSLEAQLSAPCVDNALVARGSGRRSRSGRGRGLLGAGGSGSRCLRVLNDLGAGGGRGRGVLLVDNGGGHGRSLVDGGGSLGGLSRLLLAFGEVDSVNDRLVNDVNVLHLLVLGLVVVGNGESRAGKGEDSSGGAHFDSVV